MATLETTRPATNAPAMPARNVSGSVMVPPRAFATTIPPPTPAMPEEKMFHVLIWHRSLRMSRKRTPRPVEPTLTYSLQWFR